MKTPLWSPLCYHSIPAVVNNVRFFRSKHMKFSTLVLLVSSLSILPAFADEVNVQDLLSADDLEAALVDQGVNSSEAVDEALDGDRSANAGFDRPGYPGYPGRPGYPG